MYFYKLYRWQSGKESAYQCRRCKRLGFDPWVRKIPEGGNGNLLQYSCLENPKDRGVSQAIVHGVTKKWTGNNLRYADDTTLMAEMKRN